MSARPIFLSLLLLWGSFAFGQSTSDPSPPPAKVKTKTYHDGSIRDINAVGNRNVG